MGWNLVDWANLLKFIENLNKRILVILLLVILMVSSFLLFSPYNYLDKIGLTEFRNNYKSWIGLAFLLSLVICLVICVVVIIERIIENKRIIHHLKKFIDSDKQTQYLNSRDEAVCDLTKKGIIEQLLSFGSVQNTPYNIKSWIFDYLKKHPKLLE